MGKVAKSLDKLAEEINAEHRACEAVKSYTPRSLALVHPSAVEYPKFALRNSHMA